jgi:hypothetical protein
MVDIGPQSAVREQVFTLPSLDGVFAGLGYHLPRQVKNPLGGVNTSDAIDRGSKRPNDPLNFLSKQHWSIFASTKRVNVNVLFPWEQVMGIAAELAERENCQC